MLLDLIKDEKLKYQVAANLAIYCGFRKGELLGLTWNNINLDDKTISINKAKAYTKEFGTFTKEPKSKSSIRTVVIPDAIVRLLRQYKLWQNGQRVKCGNLWDKEWNNNPWLLTQWNGKGMSYDTLSQWLRKFIKDTTKQ